MRRAFSDKQQTKLLNWIDEIKLSAKSGSKIRDHLHLDDHNLFAERNSRTAPEPVDWDLSLIHI